MRQVIALHVGQAGIQIGQSFWELLCIEHGINPEGIWDQQKTRQSSVGAPTAMFEETRKGKLVSRSFWLDSDPIVIDQVKKSKIKQVNNRDRYFLDKRQHTTFFTAAESSLNSQRQQVSNTISKMLQGCNLISAIIITCSVSGGTASGYLATLTQLLSHEFPKIPVINFIIYPSSHYSSSIVEPYNAMMAQTYMTNYSTANILFTNQKMYDCCERLIGVDRPHFQNINQIVAHVMADVTAGNRFEGPETQSLQHMLTSLVPYQRLNSLMTSYAPMKSEYDHDSACLSVNKMTVNCFQKYHNLTGFKSTSTIQHDFCSHLMYRGQVSRFESQIAIEEVKKSSSLLNLVSWSPSGISVSHSSSIPSYFKHQTMGQSRKSCCLLSNTSAIKPMFENLYRKNEMLFEKRAFAHWYFGYCPSGLFSELQTNFREMLRDYDQITQSS